MDLVDGFVVLGSVWSIIGGVYLYIKLTSASSMQIEEYRRENISLRAQNRPKEWWQEVVVNISSNPAILDKLLPLIGNANLQSTLQQLIKK